LFERKTKREKKGGGKREKKQNFWQKLALERLARRKNGYKNFDS